MARIFSIQFSYDDVQHHAMISVRTTLFFVEYTVGMLDESIAHQLPNNKIISTGTNLTFSDSTDENASQLMQVIIRAIAAYLQSAINA